MRSPSNCSTKAISSSTTTKTPCCSKVGLKRGPWTPEEDELLAKYIKKEGEGKWRTLPKKAGLLRCGKSCRLRWMNYLRPCVKRGQISPDEEDLILRLHRLLGNRWSLIAGRIPGRTDNEIKNYWNTHLSKKLISQGIDPRTHKPLNLDSIDHHQKPSSSKAMNTTRKSSSPKPPKHNNTTTTPDSSAAGEETTSENHKENLYSGSPSFDQITTTTTTPNYNINNNATYGFTSLLRSIDDWENNIQGLSNEEIDNNYCNDYGSDDVFSSFLNSLINEEAFTSQQHQVPQQEGNNINGVLPVSDPLISVNDSSFGFETDWESAALTPTIFNQTDPSKRVNDDHL